MSNLLILGEPGVCVCVVCVICVCVCTLVVLGSGKSSLLRVLRQLWRPIAGTLESSVHNSFDEL